VPDPVNGLLIYRGRGGAAGGRKPRKPRPAPGAAALELEEPRKRRWFRLRSRAKDLDPATLAGTPDAAPGLEPDRQSAARG
jgi:hypothetical protein